MVDSITFIGAGVAGVTAVDELRSNGFEGRITLISGEDRLPYDRPPLSKEVLLGAEPGGVPLRPESFYGDNRVELLMGHVVTDLDCSTREVTSSAGHRRRSDVVVLATGGSARRLRLPGADLDGIFVLRTHDDAAALGERLMPGARLVIIGGGFIGTEVAAAAVTRGADVVLLEAARAPLAAVLPELAPLVVEHHRQRGVKIRTEVAVDAFTGSDRVTGVRLATGEVVPADVVVVGIGMRPNDELAAAAGLPTGDGIHVDRRFRTTAPGVYAIGDVAAVGDDTSRRRSEHWSHAVDSGKLLARHLLGLDERPRAVPWFWSDQYHLNIQMVGAPNAADERVWRGDRGSDQATVLFHRGGRLTGAVALNRGRDIRPVSDLIAAGATLAVADLQAPDTDLRKLAKRTLQAARH